MEVLSASLCPIKLPYRGAFGKGRPRSLTSTVYRSWAGATSFTPEILSTTRCTLGWQCLIPFFVPYWSKYYVFFGAVARDASFPCLCVGAGTLVFFRLAQRSRLTGEWCCDDVQRAVVPDSLSQDARWTAWQDWHPTCQLASTLCRDSCIFCYTIW